MARLSCVLTLACIGCNQTFGLEPTVLVSDNPRILVFDNSESDTDLVDFPVLVVLDRLRVDYTRVADPSTDLRFHDPVTDVDLPFEVEQWDATGTSFVWVLVPRITAASTTDSIEMYFGPDAGGTAMPSAVWSGYELVLHGQPGSFTSPTPSGYIGAARGMRSGEGVVAQALDFAGPGTERSITFTTAASLFDGWPRFTIEMWVYADYTSSASFASEPDIIDKGNSLNLGRLLQPPNIDFLTKFQIDTHFANGESLYMGPYMPFQDWVHIAWGFDGQTQWIFRDGYFTDVESLTAPSTTLTSTGPLVLGHMDDAFKGRLDEVRISHTFFSSDWFFAQRLSMKDRFITHLRPGDL